MNALRKSIRHRSRVFGSWVLSYTIILLMPIIIGIYVYDRSIDAINLEVSRAHTATMKQFRTVMDGRFDELTMLGSYLSSNISIQRIMNADKDLDVADRINIIEAQRELARFHVAKNYLDNLFVYTNRSGTLFTSTFKYGDNGKEIVASDLLGIKYDEFREFAALRHFRDVRIYNGSVIFIQSLFLHDLREAEGLYIAVFDRKWISDFLETMRWLPEGSTRLTDGRNTHVQSRGYSLFPEEIDKADLFDREGTFYTLNDGDQIAVINVLSEITDIRFVSAMPLEIYHKSARDIQTIILVYVLVNLLVGGGLSIVFARRNYSPIKKLIKMLVERIGQSNDKDNNEFSYLEDSLKKLLNRNSSLVESLHMQSDSARNDFLVKLLKGKIKIMEKIKESMELYDIKFISERFVVVAFMVDALGAATFGEKAKSDEQTINLVNFIIRNITEEIMRESGHTGFVAAMEGIAVCVVNTEETTDDDSEKLIEGITDLLQKIRITLEERFEISANLTISGIHYGVLGITEAYNEVLEMLEYRAFFDFTERIMTADSIRLSGKSYVGYNATLDKERQFVNSIYVKDYMNAKDILNEIIADDIENNYQSIKHARCRMFGLLNLMLNAMGEIRTKTDIQFFEKLDPINMLLNTNSVKKLKLQVNTLFDAIIDYSLNKDRWQEPEWLKSVENYVREHHMEHDFSINGLSQHLGMSVSYLSRAFKKHRAIGLLDYLHKVRLDRAKELLDHKLNIKDVAEKVGYLDSKGLIRAFRRYEGITPGKYRDVD